MKKIPFDIPGFLFVLISGCLLHFVYEWSGRNPIAGFFSPVNESVWEHLKLLVFPLFIWFLFRFFREMYDFTCYIPSVCLGILSGSACIIVLFYTYSGIWGRNYLAFDMLIFILSILAAFDIQQKTAVMGAFPMPTVILSAVVLLLFLSCLALFTVYPPDLNLFKPPVTQ